jgi:hypothetical protein
VLKIETSSLTCICPTPQYLNNSIPVNSIQDIETPKKLLRSFGGRIALFKDRGSVESAKSKMEILIVGGNK